MVTSNDAQTDGRFAPGPPAPLARQGLVTSNDAQTEGRFAPGPPAPLARQGLVTSDDVRALALTLPRSYERLVADRVKFRVGQYVYLALSRDETLLGFAFPKEEREALVAAEPEKFRLPRQSDMRYNWVVATLAALDHDELAEIITDAWRMVVPKKVAAAHLGD